eukprot:12884232-Prorocentrum_lima.AAC.1
MSLLDGILYIYKSTVKATKKKKQQNEETVVFLCNGVPSGRHQLGWRKVLPWSNTWKKSTGNSSQ